MASLEKQLQEYFQGLVTVARQGDAREESFYPSLEGFLEEWAHERDREDVQVTTLPRPTDAGNPDFRVWNGSDRIVGYLEAKAPSVESLDRVERSDQLERYRETFPNLILTNFFEFRLYRDGQLIDQVQAGRPFVLTELDHEPPVEMVEELGELLTKFFDFSLPKAYSAEDLAVALARRTRFLRDIVHKELRLEQDGAGGSLKGFFKAFHDYLIGTLTPDTFADLYAQTITYGLFAARTRSEEGFNRRRAYENIPHTIGILRDVFRFISLEDPPAELEWVVDDIAEVLAVADVGEILARFYEEGKGSDPIVHFYETFLAEYDPDQRERRGVYYTPEPVVSYIVRSVHEILKEKFDRPDGLADRNVTLLDPAAGTMTFVAKAAQVAVDEFKEKYGEGGVAQFIKDHILENFYAFELMMAPYAVGHMKMAFLLEELGYRMTEDERFQFYLTNTLEMEELEQSELPGMKSLSEESKYAAEVKKEKPILVILGNPPYSGISANMGEWITDLIEDYKYVDSEHFGERKHWLHDDYVKFLRFAQWKIEQTGQGIVAMITNHNYIDNPTFRGMRWNLLETFNTAKLLDLHGSQVKREVAPDGSIDRNVFDISRGVAISLLICQQENVAPGVEHAEIWGTRKRKNEWLENNSQATTEWIEISPDPPFYFFKPFEVPGADQYNKFPSLNQIFPESVTGIITSRDDFVIDHNRAALMQRIRLFLDQSLEHEYVKEALGLSENYQWRVEAARQELFGLEDPDRFLTRILYRPFDVRWIFFHDAVVWRTRRNVMGNIVGEENLGLLSMRQVSLDEPYSHALVTEMIVDNRTFVSSKGTTLFYPLYLYNESAQIEMFGQGRVTDNSKTANLNKEFVSLLRGNVKRDLSPLDVLKYIYSILYSDYYREVYLQLLKADFPRIPFTKNRDLFNALVRQGGELIDLHLLRADSLGSPLARFHGEGQAQVAGTKTQGFRYDPQQERVHINEEQYFAPVPLSLWEYQIGGYQVLHKWLKDRKRRTLTLDEIQTYCRIVTALARTIEIQEGIDALYPQVEENLLEIDLPE